MTDLSKKTTGATCLRDKMDLLDYCKKVSARGGRGMRKEGRNLFHLKVRL